jgi:RNA polymerase subunit RPABC4/transcription elongation factor Spt4
VEKDSSIALIVFGILITAGGIGWISYFSSLDGDRYTENGQIYIYQVNPIAYTIGYIAIFLGVIIVFGAIISYYQKLSLKSSCPKCNSEIKPTWKNCPVCGIQLWNETDKRFCYKCGRLVESNFNICPYCGNKLK